MKIVFIALHFSEYSFRLASELVVNNDVLLVLSKKNAVKEISAEELNQVDIRLHILFMEDYGLMHLGLFSNAFKLIKKIRGFKPDIIHIQEAPRDYLMLAVPFIRNCPWILTVHDHKPHSGQDSHVRKRILLYRKLMRRMADAIIVHGDAIKRETQQMYPSKSESIYSIAHGPLGLSVDEDSADFDWEPGCLLFFGRIEEYKGLGYLIQAADELIQRKIVFKIIIAGTGSDLENHRQKIIGDSHYELLDTYIPNDQVESLFKRANIIVLPYTDATQSGVVSMGLKYARPIVATDVGSVSEVVRDNYNGLLVKAMNMLELANALEELIIDQEKSVRLGENSKKLAAAEISWKTIANKTISSYKEVIKN